jgi:hypothetical protein
MTGSATGPARLPVNATGVKERMLVRTALMDHDAQLQNFTPLRDRLVASGQDANAKYREIQSERDQLWAKWKKLAPARSPAPDLTDGEVLSLPIAPFRLVGPAGGFGPSFGYSGSVKMPPAQEGVNEAASVPYGNSINAREGGLLSNGSILFTGDIHSSGNAGLWLHNWTYLIGFPAPVVTSVLTYSFGVGVQVSVMGGSVIGSTTFLSFVALGETANYTGPEITVNNDGYPLVVSLHEPPPLRGVLNVRRSFVVKAGEVPAIALVTGVATSLPPNSEIMFSDGSDSFICPAATIDPATAVGPTAERGIVNFHYQPPTPAASESLP